MEFSVDKMDFRNFSLSKNVDNDKTIVSQFKKEKRRVSERMVVVRMMFRLLVFGVSLMDADADSDC